jgi:hypothetical protein
MPGKKPGPLQIYEIANGFLLFVGDRLRRGDRGRDLESLT